MSRLLVHSDICDLATEGLRLESTRERVRDLHAQGFKVRQIALALNVSTQAVYQHLRKIEAGEQASPDGKPEEAA